MFLFDLFYVTDAVEQSERFADEAVTAGEAGAYPSTPDRERLFIQHELTEFYQGSRVAIPIPVHFEAEELALLRIADFECL